MGFTRQDWTSINTIGAEGRLISKILSAPDYIAKDGTIYRLPPAQPTDYASVPKEFWGPLLFLIPYGWWSLPAVFHDGAYANLLLIVMPDGTTKIANLSKEQCDDLLLEMMQSLAPTPTVDEKAQMDAIVTGVRLGGWKAFKDDRS